MFGGVARIIERYESDWLAIDGVISVGSRYRGILGRYGHGGTMSIIVYVEHPIPDSAIPSEVDGVRVLLEELEQR